MRVVIADDNKPTRFFFERIVRDMGHEVVGVAENGPEALALCREHKPDLAFLDNTMTGGNGAHAARTMLEEKVVREILMVTQDLNAPEFVTLLAIPNVTGVKKPCGEGQIMNSIRSIEKKLEPVSVEAG